MERSGKGELEDGRDRPEPADSSRVEEALRLEDDVIETAHVAHHQMDSMARDGFDDRPRLARAVTDRLLEKDALAGRRGHLDEGCVRPRCRADVDCVETGVVGQQLFHRGKGRNREALGEGLARPRAGLDDGGELAPAGGEQARDVLGLRDVPAPDHRDADPASAPRPAVALAHFTHGSLRALACA